MLLRARALFLSLLPLSNFSRSITYCHAAEFHLLRNFGYLRLWTAVWTALSRHDRMCPHTYHMCPHTYLSGHVPAYLPHVPTYPPIWACARIPTALPTVLRNRWRCRYVYHYDFLASVQEGPQPGILVEGSRRHEQRRCQRIVRLCQYTHSYTYISMHPLLSHNLWTWWVLAWQAACAILYTIYWLTPHIMWYPRQLAGRRLTGRRL